MRPIHHAVFSLLLASAGASVLAADAPDAAIDKAFAGFRDTAGPGCAAAASRDGVTIYERGFGMANLETGTAISPGSIFHVASISKQFTATAIMLLAKEGRLSLDDNIRTYLPEMPDYGTPITIRHLLAHTSGLRDQWDLIGMARGRYAENRITEADIMDIVPRQKALNFKPGDEVLYSNTGFTLLAVIVKRVSGTSLKDFANERIFKPLDMRATHFHDDYTMVVPGRTSAYDKPKDSTDWHVSIPNFDTYGATSLFTTVGDLLKWENNFRTLKVGDAQLFKQMETVAILNNGVASAYGYGLRATTYRGARVIGHGGADAGYRAYVARYPDQGVAIAIACNASTAPVGRLADQMADALLGAQLSKAPTPPERKAQQFSAAELAGRAGVYVQPNTLQVIELSVADGKLVLGDKDGTALSQIGDNRYQAQVSVDNSLSFVDGKVAGLNRHAGSAAPVFFERHAAVAATPAQLAAYTGTYISEELGNARYRFFMQDGQLMVAIGTEKPQQARMLYKNVFSYSGDVLQFQETGGRIKGFEYTTDRARRIKFVREAG